VLVRVVRGKILPTKDVSPQAPAIPS